MKTSTAILTGALVLAPVLLLTNSSQVIRGYNALGNRICDSIAGREWTVRASNWRTIEIGQCAEVQPIATQEPIDWDSFELVREPGE